jgi:YD repeat-containing protein
MIRGNVTQTRTFLYTGSDLTSATNPENGTVTYTYDNSHHVASRTDALGHQTQYTYDAYGRLSQVQYYPQAGAGESLAQRVTYYYDNTVPTAGGWGMPTQPTFPQNGMGRLTAVTFGGGGSADDYHDDYFYMYNYNQAGRVVNQLMGVGIYSTQFPTNYASGVWLSFLATYQWDNEGRMTSLQYPTVRAAGNFGGMPVTMPIAAYQYDANGRLSGMTMDQQTGYGPQPFASATYTAAGQLQTLSYSRAGPRQGRTTTCCSSPAR